MATPIVRIKRSSQAGKIPTISQLLLGELAINTTDGKVYIEQEKGGVGVGTTVIAVNPWNVGLGSDTYDIHFIAGSVGVGTDNPTGAADPNNTTIVNAGIVTANFLYGDGSNLTDISATNITTGIISSDRLTGSYAIDITGTATTATNLAGGDTGDIPYQSSANTTTFVDASSAAVGQVLLWNGAAPEWNNVSAASGTFGGVTIKDEGSTVGTSGSVSTLNFVGSNIEATATTGANGISTITLSDAPTFTELNVTGVSTFSDNVEVGTGVTIYASTGIISAIAFYGNGENLTDLINQRIEGIQVFEESTAVGTGYSISALQFIGNNVTAAAVGLGTTVSVTFSDTPTFDSLEVTGISTLGTVKIFSGIVTASSGIVTYYGDGSNLTGTGFVPDADGNLFAGNYAGGSYNPATGTACFNVVAGCSAGQGFTDGDDNIFFGRGSGRDTTTGDANVFLGVFAGNANTTGSFNFFGGYGAGQNADLSYYNNAIGYSAGASLNGGYCNNFFGYQAGNRTTSGRNNNLFGSSAGYRNTTGCNNNFLGAYAGYCNTTQSGSVAIGASAGYSNAADNNIYLGKEAGWNATRGATTVTGSNNFFAGVGAGGSTTSGCHNNFLGCYAGKSNTTGSYNNFFGRDAGYCNTTGCANNFIGYYAGYCNTDGYDNNFIGRCAGYSNTSGSYNNFFGRYTGRDNTTGDRNNFIGRYAGYSNTTGSCNTFIGPNAGCQNTTGNLNNFIGYDAGLSNTTGFNNNMIGSCAGRCATVTGCHNTFLGSYAGKCASGSGGYNNFIGYFAGCQNTTGSFNNFIGYQAGQNNSSGIHNTFIGFNAGKCNTNGDENLFVGRCAGKYNSGNQNVFLGFRAGEYATGGSGNFVGGYFAGSYITSGFANVFVGGSSGYCNTSGFNNVFLGYQAGYSNTTGDSNVFIGESAGSSQVSGNKNIVIGCNVGVPSITGSDQLAIGVGANHWIDGDSSFNVGIGTNAPTAKLDVRGNIAVNETTVTGSATASLSTLLQNSIHTLPTATYRSIEYNIQVTEGTNFHATKILALHNGTTAYHSEYGTIFNNSSVAAFDVDVSGGNLRLLASGASASQTDYVINFVATKL